MEVKKVKRYIVAILKIGIAILLVWYLFKSGRLTTKGMIELFRPENLPYIILSGLIFILSQILSSIRLVFLLKGIDYYLPLIKCFKLTMIGNFFNFVIPGMVGGDIIKGFYLFKNEVNSRGKSSGIVIMDRIFGLSAIFFIAGFSIIYLLKKSKTVLNSYLNEMYIILVIICVMLLLFVVLLFSVSNSYIRQRLKEITLALFRRGIFFLHSRRCW
jgi:hypothetical protein